MLLYKYRTFEQFEYLLDIVINERLFCTEYRFLNDPFEGMFHQMKRPFMSFRGNFHPNSRPAIKSPNSIDALRPEVENKRICSLSSDCTDVRLWSLYASGHTGVAIEIDIPDCPNLMQVTYEESLPDYSTNNLLPITPAEILRSKTKHWEYESEYRIISDSDWFPVTGMVKRVLVGNRISNDRFRLLQNFVPSKIKVIQTLLDYEKVMVVTR
jgi:Protein of unknown function (DUF2971)